MAMKKKRLESWGSLGKNQKLSYLEGLRPKGERAGKKFLGGKGEKLNSVALQVLGKQRGEHIVAGGVWPQSKAERKAL